MELTDKEIEQFSRHLVLDEIGIEGQIRLKKSRVLVIGAGGLGCPVLQYICAAGVGEIGIVDNDEVDISNIQRQILFGHSSIGKNKAEEAKKRLMDINPGARISIFKEFLTTENAIEFISKFDFVVDCTDNYQTRYLINDACVLLNKPLIYGAIYKFEGHVAVFNFENGPTYRCLYPEPPTNASSTNCSESGVIGVLPGIIGTLQANEVLKLILGIGESLTGKLLVFDGLRSSFRSYNLKLKENEFYDLLFSKNELDPRDYQIFCEENSEVKVVYLEEFTLICNDNIQIIDVRESGAFSKINTTKSIHIPFNELENRHIEINRELKTIVICQFGETSKKAITLLQNKYNFKNLHNLSGGILPFTDKKN